MKEIYIRVAEAIAENILTIHGDYFLNFYSGINIPMVISLSISLSGKWHNFYFSERDTDLEIEENFNKILNVLNTNQGD